MILIDLIIRYNIPFLLSNALYMSKNRFLEYAVKGIQKLKPYIPGKPIIALGRELGIHHALKLASNENPLGCSPKISDAIAHLDLSRYPDGSGYELTSALAKKYQIDPNMITLGNGSNDILDMIARVFLAPKDESLFSQYAFAVYALSSQAVGAILKIVPAKQYGHDLEAMFNAITDKTKVIWIANPNNPTGTWLDADALHSFLKTVPQHIIVVIDEAYIEYVTDTTFPDSRLWLPEFANLIVTRTFSKAYGLAALRVGYSLSNPDIADLLNRVRQPFNVNALAQKAACIALSDQAFIQKTVTLNQQGMQQMQQGLENLNCTLIPSRGNFILIDFNQDVSKIDFALQKKGIITRPVANYGLMTHLRISLGLEDENKKCLEALEQVLNEN